jgi:hypothetical protein
MTAEIKKARYIYYHCTGFRGSCGNTYIREEELSGLFENVVRRVQIPEEIADWIADALRASQGDKERFHRTAIGQLQQRYLAVQSKLDRAYDDRVGRSGHGRDVVAEVGGMGDGARDNPRRDGKARTGKPRLHRHWVENSRTRKKRP